MFRFVWTHLFLPDVSDRSVRENSPQAYIVHLQGVSEWYGCEGEMGGLMKENKPSKAVVILMLGDDFAIFQLAKVLEFGVTFVVFSCSGIKVLSWYSVYTSS